MAKLKGRSVEYNLSDEHVRFEIFVGALERVIADADLLLLSGSLLAADPDRVMAQSAAIQVLDPAHPLSWSRRSSV
jgi:hypothetical protein